MPWHGLDPENWESTAERELRDLIRQVQSKVNSCITDLEEMLYRNHYHDEPLNAHSIGKTMLNLKTAMRIFDQRTGIEIPLAEPRR